MKDKPDITYLCAFLQGSLIASFLSNEIEKFMVEIKCKFDCNNLTTFIKVAFQLNSQNQYNLCTLCILHLMHPMHFNLKETGSAKDTTINLRIRVVYDAHATHCPYSPWQPSFLLLFCILKCSLLYAFFLLAHYHNTWVNNGVSCAN